MLLYNIKICEPNGIVLFYNHGLLDAKKFSFDPVCEPRPGSWVYQDGMAFQMQKDTDNNQATSQANCNAVGAKLIEIDSQAKWDVAVDLGEHFIVNSPTGSKIRNTSVC